MTQLNDPRKIGSSNIAKEFTGFSDFENIEGFLTVREDAPTATPRKLSEALVLVRSGSSTRAYFYDSGWRYVALT